MQNEDGVTVSSWFGFSSLYRASHDELACVTLSLDFVTLSSCLAINYFAINRDNRSSVW